MLITPGLNIYSVHIRPSDIGHPDRIRFVREGFSFYGFAFGALWALYHGLWRVMFGLFAANVALGVIAEMFALDAFSLMILQLGLQCWFGFAAHDCLRRQLERKGYVMTALVSGENRMRAEQRFFDRHASYLTAALA